MSDPLLSETLANIEARLEEVLSLQRSLESDVSELISGQLSTRSAITDIAKSLDSDGKSPASSRSKQSVTAESQATLRRVGTGGDRSAEGGPVMSHIGTMDNQFAALSDGTDRRKTGRGTARAGPMSPCPSNAAATSAAMSPGIADAYDIEMAEEEVDERFDWLVGTGRVTISMGGIVTMPIEVVERRNFMLDPHCKLRAVHDFISLIVLTIDVVSAPVILAWDISVEGFFFTFNIFSLSFWCIDICLSFCTGFYNNGEFEDRVDMVAKRYLKSWLLPDLSIVLADVVTLGLSASSSNLSAESTGSGAFRLTKMSRFLRLVRLVRLARVAEALARLAETSVYVEIAVETVKPLVCIVLVNHMLACTWWAISASLPSDTGLHWSGEEAGSSGLTFQELTWSYQYLTCLHWSLTQQTPGSMQVVPLNTVERAFNCFCLLLGMLLFSSLISTISAKIMQHYMKQKENLNKLAALRRFLMNKVPSSTVLAATFHANKALCMTAAKPLVMDEVSAISLLPQALKRKIKVELCTKHLRHPLLRWWFIMDGTGAQNMCQNAIEFLGLAEDDHLFFPRTAAVGAYVMTNGSALYIFGTEGQAKEAMDVYKGQFFCEAALWCKWKHVGEFTATMACELLLISTPAMFQNLDLDLVVKHVVVQYGRHFFLRLSSPISPQGDQPNDLAVPFTEFDSILPVLPQTCRMLVGAVAVNMTRKRRGKRNLLDAYIKEIRHGRCFLMVNWEGEVERIVSVVVLRLTREDGKVLVQLGEWTGDRVMPCCKLPGKKQDGGETPAQTLSRLIDSTFSPFSDNIEFTDIDVEVTRKVSERMQVPTKYLRTVNRAELTCTDEVLGLCVSQVSMHPRRLSLTPAVSKISSGDFSAEFPIECETVKIFLLADEADEIMLVGWVNTREFSFLNSPKGDAYVQSMMENVVVEPAMVEAARSRLARFYSEAIMPL